MVSRAVALADSLVSWPWHGPLCDDSGIFPRDVALAWCPVWPCHVFWCDGPGMVLYELALAWHLGMVLCELALAWHPVW